MTLSEAVVESRKLLSATAEHAWLEAQLQAQTMKGPHAEELARLNFEATEKETKGEDATQLREHHQQIKQRIADELLLELAEKGLPEAWQPKTSTNT